MTPPNATMLRRQGSVLVADDHSLYRTGLRFLLSDRLGFSDVIEAGSFDEALDKLATARAVELVLFDMSMPGVGGPESLRIVRETYPNVRVAVVTASEERDYVLAAVATGLAGYVPKSLPNDEMVAALQSILDGKIYVPNFMSVTLPMKAPLKVMPAAAGDQTAVAVPLKPVTPRQRDVLSCVRRGLSNKEIARELKMAEGTVKIHLAALFANFGVRNRTELATKS